MGYEAKKICVQGLLENLGKIERQYSVEPLIRYQHVLVLGVQRNSTWHPQYAFRSADGPLGRNIEEAVPDRAQGLDFCMPFTTAANPLFFNL